MKYNNTLHYLELHNKYLTQNHMRNTMQLRKRLCHEGLPSYGHFCAQAQSKAQKRIENERIFTFQTFVKKANHHASMIRTIKQLHI